MDEVSLVEYDPAWPTMYAAEAGRLREALPPGLILAMEHFGSTAIPGLIAKPVIDILIAVPSLEQARASAVAPMGALGYAFWADNPKRDRLFFVKGLPPAAPQRTHHVHMTVGDGEMWRRLAFRDHLRAHPEEAARYAALKRDLAARHREDREAYTEAKSGYVEMVLAIALQRANHS
ncbi:GrpB family protein [Roseococcus sp. YIM B11640]|uniref:GrpB family protein n=1 Tax=Roseococcus sp. YIM B11640 TaxID=3133973 RepID=UPI003C7D612A